MMMSITDALRVLSKAKVVELRSAGEAEFKLPLRLEKTTIIVDDNGATGTDKTDKGALVVSFDELMNTFRYGRFDRLPVIICSTDFAAEHASKFLDLRPFMTILFGNKVSDYLTWIVGKPVVKLAGYSINSRVQSVSENDLNYANRSAELFIKLLRARRERPDVIVDSSIHFAQDEPRRYLYSTLGIEELVYRLNNQQTILLAQNRATLRKLFDLIEAGYLSTNKDSRLKLMELRMTAAVTVRNAPFYPTVLGQFAALDEDPIVIAKYNGEPVTVSVVNKTITEHTEVLSLNDDGTVDYAPVRRYHSKLCVYLPIDASRRVNKDSFLEDEANEFVKYFELPNVPTVADIAESELKRAYDAIQTVEETFFAETGQRLLRFQREDIARLLVKGSGILAWDPGCGKTLAGLFFALGAIEMGKALPRVLVLAPQDLVLQWFKEITKFFGEDFASNWIVVDSLQRAVMLAQLAKKVPKNVPLFAITWYEVLRSKVGKDIEIKREAGTSCPVCKQRIDYNNRCSDGCPFNKANYLQKARDAAFFLKKFVRNGILVVDEATYIKSVDSMRGVAARRLITAKCRLLLTGTPIKNLLSDLPMLLQLAAKPNSDAYPFPAEDTAKFSKQFMVVEQNLLTGRKRVGPEPTNIAVAQKMLSGIILRRAKNQTGEDIVPLKVEIQTTSLTRSQVEWYKAWCDDEIFERWFAEVHDKPLHPLAKMLSRMSHLLFVISHPTSSTATGAPVQLSDFVDLPHPTEFTNKNNLTVELAVDFARTKGHVVLFSQTVGALPILAEMMKAKGVPVHMAVHVSSNGKVQSLPPAKRAMIIRRFEQEGGVLCASLSAMSHGHDLAFVSRAIIHSLCFAYDNYAQAIMRVHRIVSPEPVEVHVVCCDKTLDIYLLSLLQRKEQAAKSLLENTVIERTMSITHEELRKLWQQVVEAASEL